MARKSLSNKIRFEVFKRDNFTCQYCGRKAPEIVLNVDHIEPVAKGGTNDIYNLVTSCFECNNGKRDRKLDDNTEITKQHAELEILNERKKQLEQLMEWKNELKNFDNQQIEMLSDYIGDSLSTNVTDQGKVFLKKWLKKYSFQDLINATDKAVEVYCHLPNEEIFDKIERIAFYEKNPVPEYQKKTSYIRGVFRNRGIRYKNHELNELMSLWNDYIDDFEIPIEYSKQAENYRDFEGELVFYIDEVMRNGKA